METFDVEPDLNKGFTSAILRISGNIPSIIHWLNRSAKNEQIIDSDSFKNFIDARVEGVLLFWFNPFIILEISMGVIGFKKRDVEIDFIEERFCGISGIDLDSLLPMFMKKSLNKPLIFKGSVMLVS